MWSEIAKHLVIPLQKYIHNSASELDLQDWRNNNSLNKEIPYIYSLIIGFFPKFSPELKKIFFLNSRNIIPPRYSHFSLSLHFEN